jgi:hypothetical protein
VPPLDGGTHRFLIFDGVSSSNAFTDVGLIAGRITGHRQVHARGASGLSVAILETRIQQEKCHVG